MAYRRLENEATSRWLERLIEIDAPVDIRANVQQILANEQQGKTNSMQFLYRDFLLFQRMHATIIYLFYFNLFLFL